MPPSQRPWRGMRPGRHRRFGRARPANPSPCSWPS
jgi:hypothetical protein